MSDQFTPYEDWQPVGDDGWDEDEDSPGQRLSRCPACGYGVYEDVEKCPHCGEYVTLSVSIWQGKPLWWILLGLFGIIGVILAMLA